LDKASFFIAGNKKIQLQLSGYNPYLQKLAEVTNQLKSMFFYRSIDASNALPPALRSSPTLPAFKRGLKHFDLSACLYGSSSAV
jgi:hypothetical protein